ncbi:MAG: D-alanyl-D-alanine carboxypeptidase/D-alanyl-D-alanine-endopeptidase [Armatimonadetes bacterium]|nr:D-alanyl-D-alanine carboxypeptidase/D-alanyl-D-alanine-endopeptidase [Armatimonadota bacterium]
MADQESSVLGKILHLAQNTMAIRKKIAISFFLLFLRSALFAQSLPERIDEILKDPNLNHGLQAIVVRSLKTGRTLYERNPDQAMIPASNMKLFVSAAALDRLGPGFTYKTRLYSNAKPDKRGVIKGDIALVGGGDPVLGIKDLTNFAKRLRTMGIRKITGGVVVDDSMFDDVRLGWAWTWNDLPYYYSPEISALNINRNVVDVWVQPGKRTGAAAVVTFDPPTSYVEVENTALTGKADSPKTIRVDRRLGRNVISVSGSIPVGIKVKSAEETITVQEPSLYAGHILKEELSKQGIVVFGGIKSGKLPAGGTLLCEHTSPPLSKIVAMLNKPSDNLIAEVLLKTLGAVIKGKGTFEAGVEVAKKFWEESGLDLTGLRIVDGSGLSRLNYVTARNVVDLLTHMHRHEYSDVFLESLPIAGVDGTLRNRLKGTACEKNLRAKTGYLSQVSSLSGYLTTTSGEPLVFSILMNHHFCSNGPATAVQDKICELLAESSRITGSTSADPSWLRSE